MPGIKKPERALGLVRPSGFNDPYGRAGQNVPPNTFRPYMSEDQESALTVVLSHFNEWILCRRHLTS